MLHVVELVIDFMAMILRFFDVLDSANEISPNVPLANVDPAICCILKVVGVHFFSILVCCADG